MRRKQFLEANQEAVKAHKEAEEKAGLFETKKKGRL